MNSAGRDNALVAHNLSYRIGGRYLTEEVSLEVNCGEIVAIIGPNGAGKSTLLRLLTGYLTPHQGSVCWPVSPFPTGRQARWRKPAR